MGERGKVLISKTETVFPAVCANTIATGQGRVKQRVRAPDRTDISDYIIIEYRYQLLI
jgi:hypothetical protein